MPYWTHSSWPRVARDDVVLSWVGGGALGFGLLAMNGCGDARSATTSDSGARESGTADTAEPDADAMGGDRLMLVPTWTAEAAIHVSA